jgi:hypothetical protein
MRGAVLTVQAEHRLRLAALRQGTGNPFCCACGGLRERGQGVAPTVCKACRTWAGGVHELRRVTKVRSTFRVAARDGVIVRTVRG